MSRSKFKFLYSLDKKIFIKKKKSDIYILARNVIITKKYVNNIVCVFNGIIFKKIILEENMIGHKLGEFVPTRTMPLLNKKLKKKIKKKR